MTVRFSKGGRRGAKGMDAVEAYLTQQFDAPVKKQGAPAAKTGSVTLTAAELMGRMIVGTPAGAANYTLPTGANIETALAAAIGRELENDDSFDCSIINVDTTNVITILTATGLTLVGDMTVDNVGTGNHSSAMLRFRRTAANTFSVYRV